MADELDPLIVPIRKDLYAALAKARAEIHNPAMDATNPHFRSRFASLKAVIEAIVPVMAKHGIFVTQDVKTSEGGVSCVTHFLHESGQSLQSSPLFMPVDKPTAHGVGSAITYARRYQLMGMAGVVGDADDDGNAAVTASEAAGPTISAKQAADLEALIEEVGAKRDAFLKVLKVSSLEQLPEKSFKGAVELLEAKRRAKRETGES